MDAYTKSAVDTLEEAIFTEFGGTEKGVKMRAAVNVLRTKIAILENDRERMRVASTLRDYSTSELMAEYMRRDGCG